MNDFGLEIKTLRKARRITQRDLAEKAGVYFTYISKMENGQLKNFPSVDTIIKIADILNTDADNLILLAKKVPETFRETIVDDELAVALLRKMPSMTPEKKEKLRDLISDD
ncbi:MAG: helix-turn-helix domain-containing protein [Defluviitaleaceae bacterium]|nr:helix-turn-helix domain-containing protein [Defluviitaleaceae bacterium]